MVNRVIHGRGSPQAPMRLESWRGYLRRFSVDAEKDDGGTSAARRSSCLSSESMPLVWFYDL